MFFNNKKNIIFIFCFKKEGNIFLITFFTINFIIKLLAI
jgi:hypothetical protein